MEEVHGVEAQGVGQTTDIVDTEVALSALDAANIGVVKPAEVCQSFLRQPSGAADGPQVARQPEAEGMGVFHAPTTPPRNDDESRDDQSYSGGFTASADWSGPCWEGFGGVAVAPVQVNPSRPGMRH